MRKFATLLCLLIGSSCFAQHHFQITENAKIIWQKIYEASVSINEYQEIILNSGKYNDIVITDDKITCWINECPIVESHQNYSNMSILARDCNIKGFATIQFKDGRYRVTIEQIQLIQKYDSSLSRKGEITLIEGPAINRKGVFNKMVEGNTLMIIEPLFAKMFEHKKPAHLSDEW